MFFLKSGIQKNLLYVSIRELDAHAQWLLDRLEINTPRKTFSWCGEANRFLLLISFTLSPRLCTNLARNLNCAYQILCANFLSLTVAQ
jgi:hypothetical protein